MAATAGNEPVSAPGIHAPPDNTGTAAANKQLQAKLKSRSAAIRYHLLADVLYALAGSVSGVPLFGPAISAQLSAWADDLEQRATDALRDAATAQGSANYANVQLTILTGGALASNVTGGVSINDQFATASANNLGSAWSRSSEGPGGGNYGPNGSGQAVWKKFGGLWRRHTDRHLTALATDYQVVFTILGKPPEAPSLGADAYTYLLARMNAAADTYLYCRIGNNDLQIGKRDGGSWSAWSTVDISTNPGDQFAFVVGTSVDDREVVVRQNGIARLTYTDTSASAMGADYRFVGLASQAAERNVYTDQTKPAELELWAAADRLPASV
ncbi:hypothetical protein [Mycolicibacterium sp.]|uniref:DUF7257 domain-containing protein n=1 Tax=Mycolicibacterium sp. TaxID=2320850 RepID=UPI0025D19255|nr:hypothetical protein [Mycolicibacterium sp.]